MQPACEDCGFQLYEPIRRFEKSTLGLYSDARFPGRCILSLDEHYEHLEDLSLLDLLTFMVDVQVSVQAIKDTTGVDRVNVAILGNSESHVHAHLIPRQPDGEEFPQKSPWNDPRPHIPLRDSEVDDLVTMIYRNLSTEGTK